MTKKKQYCRLPITTSTIWLYCILALFQTNLSFASSDDVIGECLQAEIPTYYQITIANQNAPTWNDYVSDKLTWVAPNNIKAGTGSSDRKKFEEYMATCIINTAISEAAKVFDDKQRGTTSLTAESVAYETNLALTDSSKNEQEAIISGSTADKLVYKLSEMTIEGIQAELLYYAKDELMSDICEEEQINKIIVHETCMLFYSMDKHIYSTSLSHLTYAIRNDILEYPRTILLYDYCDEQEEQRVKDEKDEKDEKGEKDVLKCLEKKANPEYVYRNNYQVYLPALIRIIVQMDNAADLFSTFTALNKFPVIYSNVQKQLTLISQQNIVTDLDIYNVFIAEVQRVLVIATAETINITNTGELAKKISAVDKNSNNNLIEMAIVNKFKQEVTNQIHQIRDESELKSSQELALALVDLWQTIAPSENVTDIKQEINTAESLNGVLDIISIKLQPSINAISLEKALTAALYLNQLDSVVKQAIKDSSLNTNSVIDILDALVNTHGEVDLAIIDKVNYFLNLSNSITSAYKSIMEQSVTGAVTILVNAFSDRGLGQQYISKYMWVAQLADAQSNEELDVLLREMRAPLGTYKHKKHHNSITFIGSGSALLVVGNDQEEADDGQFAARLGFEFNCKGWGARLYLADFTSQFADDISEEDLEGYAEEVFRPGIGIYGQIGTSPFTVSLDYSKATDSNYRTAIGLDIRTTLFNFW